jgi:hypothetical protein
MSSDAEPCLFKAQERLGSSGVQMLRGLVAIGVNHSLTVAARLSCGEPGGDLRQGVMLAF